MLSFASFYSFSKVCIKNIALRWYFHLDLFPAVKIATKLSIAAQSRITTGHHLISQLYQCHLQRKRKSIIDNMVNALSFSHIFPTAHFSIWKSYFHFQKVEEVHIWPISGSDLQWHLWQFWSCDPEKNIYLSVTTATPHYLQIFMFSINFKIGLL